MVSWFTFQTVGAVVPLNLQLGIHSRLTLKHFTEMCSGSEAGLYVRLIDSCITQLKAQGPSRTCHESKEEEVVGRSQKVCKAARFPSRVDGEQ